MRIRKTAPKEFTIDRSKWVHGGFVNSYLLGPTSLMNGNDNMCCLGFYSKACGATNTSLREVGVPWAEIPLMKEKNGYNSPLCHMSVKINDSDSLDKKEKEKELIRVFKDSGIKLKFVGSYLKGVV